MISCNQSNYPLSIRFRADIRGRYRKIGKRNQRLALIDSHKAIYERLTQPVPHQLPILSEPIFHASRNWMFASFSFLLGIRCLAVSRRSVRSVTRANKLVARQLLIGWIIVTRFLEQLGNGAHHSVSNAFAYTLIASSSHLTSLRSSVSYRTVSLFDHHFDFSTRASNPDKSFLMQGNRINF